MATVEILAAREHVANKKIQESLMSIGAALGIEFPEAQAPSKIDPYHDQVFRIEHFAEILSRVEEKVVKSSDEMASEIIEPELDVKVEEELPKRTSRRSR